jgi:predicted nucleotidyltransferase
MHKIDRQHIIQTIKSYFVDKPVKSVYLFGSLARNESVVSDIDLLLETDKGVSLITFAKMKLDLEDWLNLKIDLVSSEGLSARLQPYIEKDKILVYERANKG